MRDMRIWPQYAAKYSKNAGKFFPDVGLLGFRDGLRFKVYTGFIEL